MEGEARVAAPMEARLVRRRQVPQGITREDLRAVLGVVRTIAGEAPKEVAIPDTPLVAKEAPGAVENIGRSEKTLSAHERKVPRNRR